MIAADPAAPWVIWKMIFWPSVGLAGLPMVRLPAMVTRKSLPSEASTAIVAASVRLTDGGRQRPLLGGRGGRAGEALRQHRAPAAPTAATPTALLKILLRLTPPTLDVRFVEVTGRRVSDSTAADESWISCPMVLPLRGCPVRALGAWRSKTVGNAPAGLAANT